MELKKITRTHWFNSREFSDDGVINIENLKKFIEELEKQGVEEIAVEVPWDSDICYLQGFKKVEETTEEQIQRYKKELKRSEESMKSIKDPRIQIANNIINYENAIEQLEEELKNEEKIK